MRARFDVSALSVDNDQPIRIFVLVLLPARFFIPSLFLSGHVFRVEGLPDDEGQALLERLLAFCTRDEVVYRHRWREGDLMLWDNRCMLHRAQGFDETHARVMHHVRVSGSEPVIAYPDGA